MVFKEGDRGYPVVRFEYKMNSERYLVTEIKAKQLLIPIMINDTGTQISYGI